VTHPTAGSEGANLTGWIAGFLVILLVFGVSAALWVRYHGI
jgi:hypothetical protein